jgi:hypothetical protein
MQLVQPAICSERISAVQIGQIDLLGQMSHHAVGVIKTPCSGQTLFGV